MIVQLGFGLVGLLAGQQASTSDLPGWCQGGVLTVGVDMATCVRPQPVVPAPVYPAVIVVDGHVLHRGPYVWGAP